MHKPNKYIAICFNRSKYFWDYDFNPNMNLNIFFRSHEAYHGESYQGGKAFDRPKKSRFAFFKKHLKFFEPFLK